MLVQVNYAKMGKSKSVNCKINRSWTKRRLHKKIAKFVNAACDVRWLIFCQRPKVACVSEDLVQNLIYIASNDDEDAY